MLKHNPDNNLLGSEPKKKIKPNTMKKTGQFEIKKARNGQFYFVLKARNGKVIANSEMYKREAMCLKGIESVKKTVLQIILKETSRENNPSY